MQQLNKSFMLSYKSSFENFQIIDIWCMQNIHIICSLTTVELKHKKLATESWNIWESRNKPQLDIQVFRQLSDHLLCPIFNISAFVFLTLICANSLYIQNTHCLPFMYVENHLSWFSSFSLCFPLSFRRF